ncbi:MAG: ABC transporter permease subunit [Polyangiales bacterium]|nr:ABC transporter permease subunit [Sandaracinus sp.]MCB9622330.1 ABC transporter permease subunit [Sandaracinus sp.]
MTIRDLGYRPYEGPRMPASHNTSVMLRHALSRAWGSWMVKVAAFLGWVPPAIALAWIGIQWWLRQQATQAGLPADEIPPIDGGDLLHSLYGWQLWLFGLLVTLGAGSSAISEDLAFKAFPFYFAKPVTPPQYLFGRMLAVGIWLFCLLFIPGFLGVLLLTGTAGPDKALESFGLILPAVVHAALIAAVCATTSVGVSSLSSSRALTMSAWILIFVVPWVLGTIVDSIGEWPWLKLASIPAMLAVVGDTLFKVAREDDLAWYHALPILGAVTVGSISLSMRRLRGAEVVT